MLFYEAFGMILTFYLCNWKEKKFLSFLLFLSSANEKTLELENQNNGENEYVVTDDLESAFSNHKKCSRRFRKSRCKKTYKQKAIQEKHVSRASIRPKKIFSFSVEMR